MYSQKYVQEKLKNNKQLTEFKLNTVQDKLLKSKMSAEVLYNVHEGK